jgi:mannose-6-phosphate isomerase
MSAIKLYPFKFEPIYQYRIWGGRRLEKLLSKPLPPKDPIGEAWILSDRDDHPSIVMDGELKGKTIKDLLADSAEELMGRYSADYKRFPLLLKFLDAQKVLSVQVHPSDDKKKYIPKGESGKTEAWVVLQTGPEGLIYAGLKPGTTKEGLQKDLDDHKVANDLASFSPKSGDAVLIKAGTVHTLKDLVVFEVQENSDVTYRLYDWDRIDEKTGKPRDLQIKEAIACIDFTKTNIKPVKPIKEESGNETKEKLLDSDKFRVWRLRCKTICIVGEEGAPRILIGVEGSGKVQTHLDSYELSKGEVMLIPASVGPCKFVTDNDSVILEVALPDAPPNPPRKGGL